MTAGKDNIIMDNETINKILEYQKNEITEHILYGALSKRARGKNAAILMKISEDELKHYIFFRKITGKDVKPDRLKIIFHRIVSRVFGYTFTIKMMENGEEQAEHNYEGVENIVPGIKKIIQDEVKHEEALIAQLEEDVLKHMSSMVLAINNSIQEITGIVVGLTFAIASSRMIGKTALISGFAATLAMVASEYLSQKADGDDSSSPRKAALYTFFVYSVVVLFLVSPFFIFSNHYLALGASVISASVIVSIFTFFMSVVKGLSYTKSLIEVTMITAGVVILSFMAGIGMRAVFG